MATTHSTAVRNGIADYVTGEINGGGPGSLVLQTAGSGTVATLGMSNPAFNPASGGTASATAINDDTNAQGGTTTQYVMRSGGASDVWFGSVSATGGGGDIQLSTNIIPPTSTVSITSFTYTAPV